MALRTLRLTDSLNPYCLGFRHIAHYPSKTFYNGTMAKDIVGPEADPQKCGIHHWAEHGIAGRGILIDYWGYAQKNGILYG